MNLNDPRDLLWMACICYGISFATGMLKTFRVEIQWFRNVPILAILCGFVAQTRALYLRGLEVQGCPLGNTLERTQFILWSLILAFLILRFMWRLNLLGTFCAGLAMGAGFLSLSLPGSDSPYWTDPDYIRLFSDPWVELHASIAIFSYGLFSLLAIVSGMYLVQRNALLSRKPRLIGSFLPPIHDLEHAGFRLLSVGVAFLTLSIVVGGMHWTRHPEFVTSTKLYVTLLLWLGYAILFFMRMGNHLYGSKFAKVSIALFCMAIISLSFVNSKSKKPQIPVSASSLVSLDPYK
ncbi:MAG TPA: hypothetical protein DCY32_06575 [Opitutae bacterium]|nr:hypothetical protein [Opitutae bacterium]|tara:strand:- start:1039 stop:1917 length:879 start_codon:yes stop_codon:yes gene_type:complete